jgi:dTDP-4-amino-4,6-dideoxygalactose transaminase
MLENCCGANRALLTASCTSALELAALLCGLRRGEEVIVPCYTFVSTANAFVLRGDGPAFVDVRPDDRDMEERTVRIAPVGATGIAVFHYVPSHSSPLARPLGVPQGHLPRMDEVRGRLLRFPMYFDLTDEDVEEVASVVLDFYRTRHAQRMDAA